MTAGRQILNARPDTLDFRDKMYVPSLYEVPTQISLEEYKKYGVPVLDQGQEGACTGFGLATVANYLLRRRKVVPDPSPVSARMLYEMAKRYDEWPGEAYSGSSARGAMKGWHKHGICTEACWPYEPQQQGSLNAQRISDALKRPLGAYYRVNHKDLVAMHSALAETGILYATGIVHTGWFQVSASGEIPFRQTPLGGHAFALVAYDSRGFWLQNSWGTKWGQEGFALITYDDWLMHATDVWVARLGAPVILNQVGATAIAHSAAAGKSNAYAFADLRPHFISIGSQGDLRAGGNFGSSAAEVETIFQEDFLRVTKNWKKKRLLFYANGGLVSETAAVQRLADYRQPLLENEIYPICFIWRSDIWQAITSVLQQGLQRRKPPGPLDTSKDFMLDRLDDALEPVIRQLGGRKFWEEVKQHALLAGEKKSGALHGVLSQLARIAQHDGGELEIHLVGHSAGSILLAPLVRLLTEKGPIHTGYLQGQAGLGLPISSCTLWAPACTVALFKQAYLPAIRKQVLARFALFALHEQAEQADHCADIYHKSLLYLISNALEAQQRIPLFCDGVPLLGMHKFIDQDLELSELFKGGGADLILSPNAAPAGSPFHAATKSHGGFDDDNPTVKATLARILNTSLYQPDLVFNRSAAALQRRRRQLDTDR